MQYWMRDGDKRSQYRTGMWRWDTGPRHDAIILNVDTTMGYEAGIAERDADVECRTWILDQDAGNWI